MKTRDRRRERAAAEWNKLRGMDPRTAAGYIWDYYKLWIIGGASLLFLLVYLGVHLASGVREYSFYLTFAGTQADVGTGSALWKQFTSGTEAEGTVEFNAEAYFDYALDQGRGNRYYDVFVSFADAGVADAVTMSRDAMTAFGATGRLLDLNSDACAGIREKYSDRFLYALPLDPTYSDSPVPVGIDLSDTRLMTEYHLYGEEDGCALGICAQSAHIEETEAFLDMLLQGEKAPAEE
ncbi:MAG: hypothetical protein IKG66_01530 [Lachnospiraceae bacterium]|nr:hypothetical protein [Lachnospiraceae bacterium]